MLRRYPLLRCGSGAFERNSPSIVIFPWVRLSGGTKPDHLEVP